MQLQAILHVGFGKTGSSAIQRYLSRHGSSGVEGTDCVYAAVTRTGAVLQGDELSKKAAASKLGYVSSAPAIAGHEELRAAVASINEGGRVPIFSQEDWARTAADTVKVFEKAGIRFRTIAYVRPQVEWFDAGWWQWWTWMDEFKRPESVFDHWSFGFLYWYQQMKPWLMSDCAAGAEIRPYPKDVVADFLSILGARPAAPIERVNRRLTLPMIKIYKAIPALRGPHGAEMDALLSSIFSNAAGAPWAVSYELAERIIEETRPDNERLLSVMRPEHAGSVKEDDRWWSPDAYADRIETAPKLELTRDEAVKALSAVLTERVT